MIEQEGGRRRIDHVLAGDYLEGVEKQPLPKLRAMREESQEEESLMSYERRLLHGRLAILRAELERRKDKDAASLVDSLPSILADRGSSHRGAFPKNEPRLEFQHAHRRVTKLVSDDTLANIPTLSSDEITATIAVLEEAEREVSQTRQRLLDVVDALNHELARRYRTGEADPRDVLSGN